MATIQKENSSTQTAHSRFFIGYICSHCHNPIIKIVTVQSYFTASARRYGEVDRRILATEVTKNLQAGTKQLSAFLKNQTPETYPMNMPFLTYQGWSDHCPICGKDEVWQSMQEFRKNPVRSTIHTFPNLETAYEWATTILAGRKADAQMQKNQLLQMHYADEGYLIRKEDTIAVRLRQTDEQNKTALSISLQPIPKIVAAEISPFEKNEAIAASALLSKLVENNAAAKGGNQ